ncbi:hypothetical protein [Saccharothrix lopnurensis]|uniref:Uncharacterized protein n=1 Tax=Saccharothrix lopnurensis TaxID=1670621 RepID=A0ABW1P8D3_9PSEU
MPAHLAHPRHTGVVLSTRAGVGSGRRSAPNPRATSTTSPATGRGRPLSVSEPAG